MHDCFYFFWLECWVYSISESLSDTDSFCTCCRSACKNMSFKNYYFFMILIMISAILCCFWMFCSFYLLILRFMNLNSVSSKTTEFSKFSTVLIWFDTFKRFLAENSDKKSYTFKTFLFFVMLLVIVLRFCDCKFVIIMRFNVVSVRLFLNKIKKWSEL